MDARRCISGTRGTSRAFASPPRPAPDHRSKAGGTSRMGAGTHGPPTSIKVASGPLVLEGVNRVFLRSEAALQRPFAPLAHEAAVVLALRACPVEEPLLNRRVVAIAHGRDHVTAVVAQVLGRLLAHNGSLVGDQGDKRDERGPDDRADGPARQGLLSGQEVEGPREVHGPPIRASVYQGVPPRFLAASGIRRREPE